MPTLSRMLHLRAFPPFNQSFPYYFCLLILILTVFAPTLSHMLPCACFQYLTSPSHDITFSYSHLCTCLFDCMSLMHCIYVSVTVGSHAISYACLYCYLALVCLCRSDNRVRVVYVAIVLAFLPNQLTSFPPHPHPPPSDFFPAPTCVLTVCSNQYSAPASY